MNEIKEQEILGMELENIISIFKASGGEIRPHFILTGPSGSGKSHIIQKLANEGDIDYLEVNAAQLTKEGTSGNSLSKALAPLSMKVGNLTICFVDEFDKLFISGNTNSSLAHETTNGVQNEFLKVLESDTASVFGDYGKYFNVPVDKVLFIFAGAFNGEENITVDRLRDFGVKTEFIGRVGLVYNAKKLSLESMLSILNESNLLNSYLDIYEGVDRKDVIASISEFIKKVHEKNEIGVRLVNTLINQYFIKGGDLGFEDVKDVAFQKKLELKGVKEWQ